MGRDDFRNSFHIEERVQQILKKILIEVALLLTSNHFRVPNCQINLFSRIFTKPSLI